MIMETAQESAKLIVQRLQTHFKRLPRTRYCIRVVNNGYDHQYNFFIEVQNRHRCARSIPLHAVTNYSLDNLEQVVRYIKQCNQLTMHFTGFGDDQRWPVSGQLIRSL